MMAGVEKISIVIPNYNGEKYVKQCLESLLKQSFKRLEIILVDNASTDQSLNAVRALFPQVTVISLPENRGFAAAVNKGIEAAIGQFVIILNNDTQVPPNFVSELYAGLAREPDAAMAAPKMLFLRNPRVVNSAGLGYCVTGSNHDIGFGRADGPEFDNPAWVFGPSGGAGMYRREMLRDLGGFDEDLFMYYEDVDFSFRAQLKGYRCIYIPTAVIYHAEGGSSEALPRTRNFYFARNSLLVVLKNFPTPILVKYLPAILWEMAKRTLSPLRKGDASALLGYCSALRMTGKFLRKRREAQSAVKIPAREIGDMLNRNRSVLRRIDVHGRPCEERR